jgi:pyruvate/2-oxoglutarate dehydrogenase complex dihydrolipoamide acyltransferase (E2) component
MKNFVTLENQSAFRRMAAAMWLRPNDSTIYGASEIDMRPALALIEKLRADGMRVTVTHLVAKAVAVTLARHPDFNAKVRFWGKLERRKTVDIFLQVASEDGKDLSGHRIAEADKMPLKEVSEGLRAAAKKIRSDEDPKFKKSKNMLKMLPWWLLRMFLGIASFLTNELGFDLSGSGMPPDPFGAAMVTSLGMHEVDEAYAPFTPVARCLMIILVPAVRDRVVVENGQMVIRPMLKLCGTFDHRIIDGHSAAVICREIRSLFAQPDALL